MKKGILIGLMSLVLVGCGVQDGDTNKDDSRPVNQSEYTELVEDRTEGLRPEGFDGSHIDELTPPTESDFELDYTHYNKITADEGIDMVESGKSGIIYFGWTECIYCYRFRQTYDFVLEDLNLDIDYIEIADVRMLGKEVQDELFGLYDVMGTPTVVAIKDGVEIDRISDETMGTLDYVELLDWTYSNAKEVGVVE